MKDRISTNVQERSTARAQYLSLVAGLAAALAIPAEAVQVSRIYVGTLSSDLTTYGDTAGNNPGQLTRGNKYVIKTSFDTDDLALISPGDRIFSTRPFQSIALNDGPGGTNTFELFIPSEGFGGILTQTGQDHFAIGPGYAPTAEIHFFNPCGSAATCDAQFRGFEFESNFIRDNSPSAPNPGGDFVFELFDSDTTISGTTVSNQVVNVLDGNLQTLMGAAGTGDVLSESNAASGGQQNPGVFLEQARAVVAEAGASPLVYSASSLSVTTDGGTETITESVAPVVPGQLRSGPSAFDNPIRHQDNDLGAGRGDGEDFLEFLWNADGAVVAGDQSGTRLDRTVIDQSPGGRSFDNLGSRTVDDVNVILDLAASGLQNTLDTTTVEVTVTESITGFSDTDSVAVSYQNAGPNAEAGGDIVFNAANFMTGASTSGASASDADMAANTQVAGFETLTAAAAVGGTGIGANDIFTGSATSNPVSRTIALLDSGLTMTTDTSILDLTVSDFAGSSSSDTAGILYQNTLPVIANASHTAQGLDIRFDLSNTDADLAVNSMLAGFEALMVEILINGADQSAFFASLIGDGTGGSQLVSNADLMGTLGLGAGLHTFKVNVLDKTLAFAGGLPVMSSFQFEVLQQGVGPVPLPPTTLLFLLGLLAMAWARGGLVATRQV